MKEAIVLVSIIAALFIAGITLDTYRNANAATVDAAPPCELIAATGNIVISRCEDEETGMILYVNNIGFMVLGE